MGNSKDKGNRGERELVKIFNNRFGDGLFKRTPQSGAITGGFNRDKTENLPEEVKIALTSDIMTPKEFKFVIEHKFYKAASFWDLFNESSDLNSWVLQVENDSSWIDRKPMLIVKYNNKKRIVYIRENIENYIFEWKGWYCYWLEDLLKIDDSFFLN